MTDLKRQLLIEDHVVKHNGGWWNILGTYEDGVMIVWGRGKQTWTKFIKVRK